MPEPKSPYKRVRRHFNQKDLKRVCEMHETEFAEAYGTDIVTIAERKSDNFYLYKDNGSNILAVAHLDTVMPHEARTANFVSTQAGPIIFSGALDDRLGAYTILELLPKLGLKFDILLTVGEESGRSTAKFFEAAKEKEYLWMIEFDRGGTDVVMYQYDDHETRQLVSASGAKPNDGIFSDISYLEHLEIKGFNWGVGYRDYHGPRSHAYLEDYWMMIGHFLKFHEANKDNYLPHEEKQHWSRWGSGSSGGGYSSLWSSDYDWSSGKSSDNWWDSRGATDSDVEEGAEGPKREWEESDFWTDEQWDAYIEQGIEAARALDPDWEVNLAEANEGLAEAIEDVDVVFAADDDMVSEDFSEVNAALVATSVDDDDVAPAGNLRSYN